MDYEPDPDFFGSDVLKLQVEDYRGRKTTAIKTIEVNNVNDAPTLSTIGTFQAAEDTWSEITYAELVNKSSAEDGDGDPIAFEIVEIKSGSATIRW